jgi:hypothetical protein
MHSCATKITFGLVGHEELRFFIAIGTNFWCQELVPSVVKNPNFSWPIFIYFWSFKFVVGGAAKLELGHAKRCGQIQVRLVFCFVLFFFWAHVVEIEVVVLIIIAKNAQHEFGHAPSSSSLSFFLVLQVCCKRNNQA